MGLCLGRAEWSLFATSHSWDLAFHPRFSENGRCHLGALRVTMSHAGFEGNSKFADLLAYPLWDVQLVCHCRMCWGALAAGLSWPSKERSSNGCQSFVLRSFFSGQHCRLMPGAAYAHVHESTGPWQALANALAQNATMTELNLNGNRIGDAGAKARPGF